MTNKQPTSQKRVQKWEYFITKTRENFTVDLKPYGTSGWELVTVLQEKNETTELGRVLRRVDYIFYFKRPIQKVRGK